MKINLNTPPATRDSKLGGSSWPRIFHRITIAAGVLVTCFGLVLLLSPEVQRLLVVQYNNSVPELNALRQGLYQQIASTKVTSWLSGPAGKLLNWDFDEIPIREDLQ